MTTARTPVGTTSWRARSTRRSRWPARTPILIGGNGEKKTLRLVALYAQACNLFAGPDLARKLDVLRGHCDAVGRNYNQIEKTVSGPLDPGPSGQNVNALIGRMRELAKLGITHYQGAVPNVAPITPLEMLGQRVIPAAAEL
jgi:hypothetical protein